MDEAHYRKLERMYHGAPINQIFTHRLEVEHGRAVIRWEVQRELFHAADALHGSAYFKLLDDAAFFAANSVVAEHFVLTASFHVHFLRPVLGGTVRAEGQLVSEGRHLLVAESVIFDDDEREVGLGSGTFARSQVPLTDRIGYR
ncbi:MAG: PaaI family thioesterase [Sandaracinaceae bacterium]